MSNDLSSRLQVDFGQNIYSAHPEFGCLAPLFKCDAARQLATTQAEKGTDALAILNGLIDRYLQLDPKNTLLPPSKMNRYLFALAEGQASDESTQANLKAYSFQKSTWLQSIWYVGTYWMYLFMSDPKVLDCSDLKKLGREEYVACKVANSFFAEKKAEELKMACPNLDAKSPYPAEYTESFGAMLLAAHDGKLSHSLDVNQHRKTWTSNIKPTFCEESTSHPLHEKYCSESVHDFPSNSKEWLENHAKDAFLPPKVLEDMQTSSYASDKDEL